MIGTSVLGDIFRKSNLGSYVMRYYDSHQNADLVFQQAHTVVDISFDQVAF